MGLSAEPFPQFSLGSPSMHQERSGGKEEFYAKKAGLALQSSFAPLEP